MGRVDMAGRNIPFYPITRGVPSGKLQASGYKAGSRATKKR